MMYLNPVYNENFADPFCLAFAGEYWCFCSGFWKDGRVFGVLHSHDLVNWEELPGAMAVLDDQIPFYWAPEVTYYQSKFYLYYSAGNEEIMHLRVAVADHPAGPYTDSGHELTREQFAIDAHVFEDDDGSRYLFYASDHLQRDRVGTGTVVDRLVSPYQLEGKPSPVSLPAYDWQIYDPRRAAKNNLCWHTIEGSFTLKHKNRYYQMFSGGNYHNISYGVSYAVTDAISSRSEWQQSCDSLSVLPVLRTIPEKVVGPGHNSVVVGPDGWQLYCVYHVITQDEPLIRVMAIDRLEFVNDDLVVLGASYQPQPSPIEPIKLSRVIVPGDGPAVSQADNSDAAPQAIIFDFPYFLHQFYARSPAGEPGQNHTDRITWIGENDQVLLELEWRNEEQDILIRWLDNQGSAQALRRELRQFPFDQWFAVQMELNGEWVKIKIASASFEWAAQLGGRVKRAIFSGEPERSTEIRAQRITYGSNELFWLAPDSLAATGWQTIGRKPGSDLIDPRGGQGWQVENGVLVGRDDGARLLLVKDLWLENYEVVINASGEDETFEIYPVLSEGSSTEIRTWISQGSICIDHDNHITKVPLDEAPSVNGFYHLRFRKLADRLFIQVGRQLCGEYPVAPGAARVGLGVRHAEAKFDLVRITKIS